MMGRAAWSAPAQWIVSRTGPSLSMLGDLAMLGFLSVRLHKVLGLFDGTLTVEFG
jgi:hypothetical protein